MTDINISEVVYNIQVDDESDRIQVIQSGANGPIAAVKSVNGLFGDVVLSTDEISEGTNLYYTDARVNQDIDTRVNKAFVDALDINADELDGYDGGYYLNYTNFNNKPFIPETTDDITEATNLYYTDTRVRNAVSATGDLSYNSSTGQFSVTTYKSTDFDTDFATKSTDDLSEGTNLYYTDTRARNAVSAAGDLNYNSITGVFDVTTYKSTDFDSDLATKTTNDLTEGTNLYYTQARFDNAFGNKTTTDLNEGTNLYYTTARANNDFDTRLATKDTDDVSEGITNKYYTDTRVDANIATKSTDDISEGITNKYYTDARAQSAITGGTGVSVNGGTVSIGQSVSPTDNVTFNTVVVDGDLTVRGTTTTVDTNQVNIGDNIIILNSNETSAPTQDAGFAVERGTSPNVQFVWDETNDIWTTGTQSISAQTFVGNLTGQVSDITNHSTTDLSEGTNLYYTDTRANSAIDTRVNKTFVDNLGVDADTLDGFNSSQTTSANSVVVRDNSGDINARLFKSEWDVTNTNINFIMTQIDTATNNYIRPSTPAQFRAAVTDGVYETAGAVSTHEAATDPHPQYVLDSEYDEAKLRESLLNEATLNLDFANNIYEVYDGPVNGLTRVPFNTALDFSRASTAIARTATNSLATVNIDEQRLVGNREGLLIEGASTNLTTNSENASGNPLGGGRSIERDVPEILAPDGSQTVDKVTSTGGGTTVTPDLISMTAGQVYVFSFWAARPAGEEISGGTSTYSVANPASVTILENTTPGIVDELKLKRYHITVRCDTSGDINFFPFIVITNQTNPYGYFWGFQVEEGEFPTSYIPTEATTVTRAADNCDRTLGAELSVDNYTAYIHCIPARTDNGAGSGDVSGSYFVLSNGGPFNWIGIYNFGVSTRTGRLALNYRINSGPRNIAADTGDDAIARGTPFKAAYTVRDGQFVSFAVNGQLLLEDYDVGEKFTPYTTLSIDNEPSTMRESVIIPRASSSEELIALTKQG